MAEKRTGRTGRDEHPCHWTWAHIGHYWWPAVPDPVEDRVLHLGVVRLWCPGNEGRRG